MTGKTHLLAGLSIASIPVINSIGQYREDIFIPSLFGFLTLVMIGSILPDIDDATDQSIICQSFPFFSKIIKDKQKKEADKYDLIRKTYYKDFEEKKKILKKQKILSNLFLHRYLFHTFIPLLFILFLMMIADYHSNEIFVYSFLGLLLGYISHIVLDIFSNGVYFLYPFYKKKIRIGKIKTNGKIEKYLFRPLFIIFPIVYLNRNLLWNLILNIQSFL